jgi:hypothetical protein
MLLVGITPARLIKVFVSTFFTFTVGSFVSLSACAERAELPHIEGFFVKEGSTSPHFLLEVCSSDAERRLGLMYRKKLAADRGMLFVFPDSSEHPFWMKNTYISLDMIFVDEGLTVVGVLRDVPPLNEEPRTVGRESMYVIELPAGTAEKYGLSVGYRFEALGPIPRGR